MFSARKRKRKFILDVYCLFNSAVGTYDKHHQDIILPYPWSILMTTYVNQTEQIKWAIKLYNKKCIPHTTGRPLKLNKSSCHNSQMFDFICESLY